MIKLLLCSLIFLSSCGKNINEDVNESLPGLEIKDGSYKGFLNPVNTRISTTVTGQAAIDKYGDDFKVYSILRNAPNRKFVQYLHTGSYCPNLQDDQNGDGYLDRFEFMEKAGPAILPLDADLSSQDLGSSFTLFGNFDYERSTSYSLMLFDLHLPDELLNDYVVKLKQEHLQLEKKVIAVYLQRVSELPIESSREVPFACGILKYEHSEPTERDNSESDLPNDDEVEPPRRHRPGPPRIPSPRPIPRPPNPEDSQYEPPSRSSSWRERLRQRWRRWRSRSTVLVP